MQDQVIIDMDGLGGETGILPPPFLNDPRRRSLHMINHRGMEVTEMIVSSWHPGVNKLLWCRATLEETTVGGRPNPLFHVRYADGQEEEARTKVRTAFDAHWFPEADPKPQTWRDREPLL